MIVDMPSPLGRVPPKGAGEVCPQGTVAPSGQYLIRPRLRSATFPRGEGFALPNNHLIYFIVAKVNLTCNRKRSPRAPFFRFYTAVCHFRW